MVPTRRTREVTREFMTRRSTRSQREPTPVPPTPEPEEEEPIEEEEPPETSEIEQAGEEEEEVEEEEEEEVEEEPEPQPIRRKPGRPRVRDTHRLSRGNVTEPNEDLPERGTPSGRRKRGRPYSNGTTRGSFRGGFRGRPRGSRVGPRPTKIPEDEHGNPLEIVDDEVVLLEDEEGRTKVDSKGRLQGNREYRVRTFTIIGRDERLYMLSTEPARCCGFRDSYLFFTKHPHLYKIIIGDEEKRDLIERDILPHSYKGRAIGVVTARSVFREFGALIVVGGKRITDDFQVTKVREEGGVEGDLADPNDRIPPAGQEYNRNQYVAWHGASSVYHTNQPAMPIVNGKQIVLGKRKPAITSANWMFEHAREASRFNSMLARVRKEICEGTYDPHTNLVQFPKIVQHTHAKWEQVNDAPPHDYSVRVNGTPINGLTDGQTSEAPPTSSNTLPPVSSVISRNYLVVDTHQQAPPHASFSLPGADYNLTLRSSSGLADIDVDKVFDDLPPECREALLHAKAEEAAWRQTWTDETRDGMRGDLRIGL